MAEPITKHELRSRGLTDGALDAAHHLVAEDEREFGEREPGTRRPLPAPTREQVENRAEDAGNDA